MKNLTTSSSKLGKTNVFREATLIALLLLTPLCCQAQKNIGKRHEFLFWCRNAESTPTRPL